MPQLKGGNAGGSSHTRFHPRGIPRLRRVNGFGYTPNKLLILWTTFQAAAVLLIRVQALILAFAKEKHYCKGNVPVATTRKTTRTLFTGVMANAPFLVVNAPGFNW